MGRSKCPKKRFLLSLSWINADMVVFPNIKINLGLNVLAKRDDGYHDIATVMVGVDWCDVLEVVVSSSPNDTLHTSGLPVDCPPEKNLVVKALNALRRSVMTEIPPLDVYLHKNVPDGAGLGGGSADAAFMIKAVNDLLNLNLDENFMAQIAANVGSDCPFFIYNTPMLATGRGEILTPLDSLKRRLEDYLVVVVKAQDTAVSTAQAYAGINPHAPVVMPHEGVQHNIAEWPDILVNDFEASIFAKTEKPCKIKNTLYKLGALYAAMSGSGSAVFALFEKSSPLEIDFSAVFPQCNIHVGKFIL